MLTGAPPCETPDPMLELAPPPPLDPEFMFPPDHELIDPDEYDGAGGDPRWIDPASMLPEFIVPVP